MRWHSCFKFCLSIQVVSYDELQASYFRPAHGEVDIVGMVVHTSGRDRSVLKLKLILACINLLRISYLYILSRLAYMGFYAL